MKQILWIVALITAGIYITGPLVDPDLWWHITAGRWILSHHSIPHSDYWNLFGQGQPWRAYSWSNEIVYAWLESQWHMHGLLVLKFGIAIGYALSLGYCLSKISRDWFIGCLLAIYTVAASFNHFTLRPQSLVWIYFVLAIYLAEMIVEGDAKRKHYIYLALVFCAWANTHITTALGLLAIGTWMFDAKAPLRVITPLAIAAAATLVTPYVGGEWLTFFSKTGHPFEMNTIAEFQPATIMQYSTVFLVLGVSTFFLLLGGRAERIPPARLIGCLAFVIAGLAIVKFMPFGMIYTAAAVALLWRESAWGTERTKFVEGIERLRALINWIPREGLAFLLLCYCIVLGYRVWQAPVSTRIVPVQAVDFIQAKALPTPILNDFGRGGYMMYRFSDAKGELDAQHKVPIDGRTNVNPKEVWESARAALLGKHNWRDFLNKVQPQTILWKSESPFVPLLIASKEWCRVFKSGTEIDGYSVLVPRSFFEARKNELTSDSC